MAPTSDKGYSANPGSRGGMTLREEKGKEHLTALTDKLSDGEALHVSIQEKRWGKPLRCTHTVSNTSHKCIYSVFLWELFESNFIELMINILISSLVKTF